MNTQTIENINNRINNLSYIQKLTFVYIMFQRLFPNYVAFYKHEKWGNPEILQKAAIAFKDLIIKQTNLTDETKNIIAELKKVTPDTDEFTGFSASLALDTCAMLLEGFAFAADKNNRRMIDISTSSLDLTQMYIEFRDKTNFDDYAFSDSLIVAELQTKLQILDLLENQTQIDESFLRQIKIEQSKLGSLITGIPENELEYTITEKPIQYVIPTELQLDDEIQLWIKGNNININELVRELIKNFYHTVKTVQKNAAF